MSKYFSSAKENRNNEKIDIKTEGINVNKAKYVIYFLFDFNPSLSISFLIAFWISKKINIKRENNNIMFSINKYCKFWLFNSIKPLSN